MQETLYQTANARDSISDSRCRSFYIRQQMQEIILDSECKGQYQTADAVVSLSDNGCERLLYQTAGSRVSISDSGCKRLFIRQQMRETLYQPADARESLSDK